MTRPKPPELHRKPGRKPRQGPPPKRTFFTFEVPPATQAAYKALCTAEGVKPSEDLRRLVEGRLGKVKP